MNEQNAREAANLGAHVKQLRQSHGLSVRQQAARAGVDATWLSRVERGVYTRPDPRLLWQLARALDVEVADLYLTAGYGDAHGLPGLAPYLRAKYQLPEEAITQMAAYFDFIAHRYSNQKGEPDGRNHDHTS
ncbi:hypothetical protein GCM10009682_16240 [Luedemannella flava]|uniref:HTH cro/C1-type domain-containing protein n=1 Tax=Luedemannella flava TaxID=349316 RepID=A0ABN2LPU7_9ACTN